jgi:beta-galactosidase
VKLSDAEGKEVARQEQAIALNATTDPNAAMDPETPAPPYASTETTADPARHTVTLRDLGKIKLWDLDAPNLYTVHVHLLLDGKVIDNDSRRIGFREASFTEGGFSLNGKIVKLRGLDRHQTFPFVGQAMPARPQIKDAEILRRGLHCNIVRTSHYPQSKYFLDRCDEIGLLVLEEIPGWQHIGPEAWKLVAIDNVGRMIRRDWNHPSIILWGVRINESKDDHSFYTRTNALAHALDATRQTGGIRYFQSSEFLEDVFTMNDFGFPLLKPNHPRYLNTEFVGHTYPTKTTDDDERQREHTLRHARIHNQLASDPQYAGGIGWCAFDYNTHANFGSGDRICYHGVTDIFRENKPAAGFYKSQCDPEEEIVLEPAFHWARGDESVGFSKAVVCSNVEHIKFFARDIAKPESEWKLAAEVDPERKEFNHLKYAPFVLDVDKLDLEKLGMIWADLRIDGFIGGKQVISKMLSGSGVDMKFVLLPDDDALRADGADTTRVVLRVTDQFGAMRTYADDPIHFTLEGPAELIGDNPFSLVGGTGAVWVRAKEQAGTVKLTAKHPRLGSQSVTFRLSAVPPEVV